MRYLKGSPGLGLFYSIDNDLKIQAFSVSDWATCPVSRKLGYCIFLGKSLISWKAKKQTTISRSSTEAEYRALTSLASDLQWLKSLCDDLHLPILVPFSTFFYSEFAIQLVKNPSFHERTKHLKVVCHLIRIKIQEGLILLSHVPSGCQLAYVFTKALYPNPFVGPC